MADYVLTWCEQCQNTTWQTHTDYEGDVCASGNHLTEVRIIGNGASNEGISPHRRVRSGL